jgi:hypothetical protein
LVRRLLEVMYRRAEQPSRDLVTGYGTVASM